MFPQRRALLFRRQYGHAVYTVETAKIIRFHIKILIYKSLQLSKYARRANTNALFSYASSMLDTLRLQTAQSRSYLYLVGSKVGTICLLGALGIGCFGTQQGRLYDRGEGGRGASEEVLLLPPPGLIRVPARTEAVRVGCSALGAAGDHYFSGTDARPYFKKSPSCIATVGASLPRACCV